MDESCLPSPRPPRPEKLNEVRAVNRRRAGLGSGACGGGDMQARCTLSSRDRRQGIQSQRRFLPFMLRGYLFFTISPFYLASLHSLIWTPIEACAMTSQNSNRRPNG